MKEENVRKIGIAKKVQDLDVFVKFLITRFPNESDEITGYFGEWADRFNTGTPERYMDNESLRVYNEVSKLE